MKQTSVNLDVTPTQTGFNISNSLYSGTLGISGGITLIGGNPATITFPDQNTLLAGVSIPNTFTSLQRFSAGLSASGATFTGNISAPNIVNTFNGLTGAVSGVTTSVANTFTALQTFVVGLSATNGITFGSDISVHGLRVGRGKGAVSSNTAVGVGALTNNDSGTSNTAVGLGALGANTSGGLNTAVGVNALAANTSGGSNTAVGLGPLAANTTGASNTAVGRAALAANTTGSFNIAVGVDALNKNISGGGNIAVGPSALTSNTTGEKNIAVGEGALAANIDGTDNTAVGEGALAGTTSGDNNIAVGYQAGRYRGAGTATLTSATGGVFIGFEARGSANAQTNEIVIGTQALGLGSNTAVIGATLQQSATIYGTLNTPRGISTSGITLTGPNIRTNQSQVNMFTETNTGIKLGGIGLTLVMGSTLNGSETTISSKRFVSKTHILFNGPGIQRPHTIYPNNQFQETFQYALVGFPNGWSGTVDLFTVDKKEYSNIDLFIQSERGISGQAVTKASQVDKISAMYISNVDELPTQGEEVSKFNYNNYYNFAVGPATWDYFGVGATFLEFGLTWDTGNANNYKLMATIPEDKALSDESVYINILLTGIGKIFNSTPGSGGVGGAGGGGGPPLWCNYCDPNAFCYTAEYCLAPPP